MTYLGKPDMMRRFEKLREVASQKGMVIRMEKHHPFWKKNASFQYTYCFGLGVMSMGHMKSIMETQDFFEDILKAIRLPESQWQQIFFDLNNHFEEWIDKVFALLWGKEEQYCLHWICTDPESHGMVQGIFQCCSGGLSAGVSVFPSERGFFSGV